MQSSRGNSAQEIDTILNSEVGEFKKLAHALADDTAAADNFLQAQAAWLACYTQNDCDTLVNLPQMAENLQHYRRDKFFREHPDQVLTQVPGYLQHHPEVLDLHLNQSFTPAFQIQAAQHINENQARFAGGTLLLTFVIAMKLKLINPWHWFDFFRNKPIQEQHDLSDVERYQCASR